MPLSYAALRTARFWGPTDETDMSSYTTSEIRSGMKVILEGDPYAIVDNEFVKPGKGQAFNRIKVRNLKNGRTIERTFRSGESLEAADVMDAEMQYLYNDGSFWHFMIPDNFEQYSTWAGGVTTSGTLFQSVTVQFMPSLSHTALSPITALSVEYCSKLSGIMKCQKLPSL